MSEVSVGNGEIRMEEKVNTTIVIIENEINQVSWLCFFKGKIGRVLDIRGWDNESSRSVANVAWSSGSTNVYRLGHKGNCDIKFVQPTSGGSYYPEHLPILGL